MVIEAGSQNASRLAGVYAYPSYSYSSQAVSPVDRVPASPLRKGVFNPAGRSSLQNEIPSTSYEKRLFQNGTLFKGLLLDISA